MKNAFKYILPLFCGLLLCFMCITTAHAQDIDKPLVGSKLEIGETAVYHVRNTYINNESIELELYYSHYVTVENQYSCIYLKDDGTFEFMGVFNGVGTYSEYTNGQPTGTPYPAMPESVKPIGFGHNPYVHKNTTLFNTNFPIFGNQELAERYYNEHDEDVLTQAINFKKSYEDGNWVKPFEDYDINDSTLPIPILSNLSHEGFCVIDIAYEYDLYIDVYVESGIENPFKYIEQDSFGTTPLYTNVYGCLTDTSEVPLSDNNINLIADFGINNSDSLNNSKNEFYSSYPSAISFYNGAEVFNTKFHKIWGQPFAKPYVFWGVTTDVTQTQRESLSINIMPLCYTTYKVRYYYYNESDGMHFGPWCSYTYYSDGRIEKYNVFEDNNGNIVDTPIENGTIDDSGNVNIGVGSSINLVDLDNPNELFGYLRSIINNIDSTSNSFTTLFSAYFTVIPADIQIIIWLSIALMCFGSIILWVWRK